MTALIYNNKESNLKWAREKIGIRSFRSDAQCIGLRRGGNLVAVAVFDTFSSFDCSIHIASDGSKKWLTRSFLTHVFAYAFIQCNLRRVSSQIAESNAASLRFNLKLGFKVEGRHPMAAKDGALISTGMLRSDCPYVPESVRNCKE